MKDIIINVFAVVGVFAIIITIGMFLLIIVEDIRDHIRITKRRMKRVTEMKPIQIVVHDCGAEELYSKLSCLSSMIPIRQERRRDGTVLVKYQNHLLEQKRHRFMRTITSTLTCFPLKSMQEQLKHIHIRTNLPNVMVKVRCLKA